MQESTGLNTERHHSRLEKLEEWQKYMYREIIPKHGRIDSMEDELKRINDLFKIREDNIRKLSQ